MDYIIIQRNRNSILVSCYFEVFERRNHAINSTNVLTLISRPFMSYFTILS